MGALTRRSACLQPHQNSQEMVILSVPSQLVEHKNIPSFLDAQASQEVALSFTPSQFHSLTL